MNQFNIEIQIELMDPRVDPLPEDVEDLLAAAALATLQYEEAGSPVALTLLLTGDEALQQMNRDFLGIDAPTDVLSFPSGDIMPGMEETGDATYLGDIAISITRAAAQARAGGHGLAAELQLLAVHGVLHLLGHDHAEPGQKAAMWAVQTAVLRSLGSEITAPA